MSFPKIQDRKTRQRVRKKKAKKKKRKDSGELIEENKAYSTMELEEDFWANNFRARNADIRILRLSANAEVVPSSSSLSRGQ